MTVSRVIARFVIMLALCRIPSMQAFGAALGINPGNYDIRTETLLPHLEENMRYATTRQRRCMDGQDASTLFPILRHEALAGCVLTDGQIRGEQWEYLLRCSKPETATGSARLTVQAAAISGVVDIKLGGKNMTLSQRISGQRVGDCGKTQ